MGVGEVEEARRLVVDCARPAADGMVVKTRNAAVKEAQNAAMEFLLENDELARAFNLTAPEPVTNKGFCMAVRHHLRAVVCLPVPGLVLRLALGEMADELLLKGQRVVPRRLQEAGFEFRYKSLPEALSNLLAR